jgi:hypothetical protein
MRHYYDTGLRAWLPYSSRRRPPMGFDMKRSAAALALLLALAPSARLAWESRDMPHLGYFHDDSIYWITAKSLADGAGYRIASLPGAPFQTKYPPLYPLLLAGVWRAAPGFPANLGLAMLLMWIISAAYVAASLVVFRDLGAGGSRAAALAALVALNPWVALGGASLLSELPFSVLAFAALALVERARRAQTPSWLAAAAGFAGSLAFLTRSAGIVLLAAGPLALARSKRRKGALLYAAAMLPAVAGWTLWAHLHRTPQSDALSIYYTDYLGYYLRDLRLPDLPLVVWKNLDSLVCSLGGLFVFGLGDGVWGRSAARILAAAAVAGVVRLARRGGCRAHHFFAAAYAGLLLVWDFTPDQRFLVPVLPIALAGLYCEMRNLAGVVGAAWRAGRANRAAAGTVCVALFAGLLMAAQHNAEAFRTALPEWMNRRRAAARGALSAYRWIAVNLPRSAGLLAYYDPLVYLHTGRRACRFFIASRTFYREDRAALVDACRSAASLAEAQGLAYALLTPGDPEIEIAGEYRLAGERLLAANPEWRLIHREAGGAVYLIRSARNTR